MTTYLPALRKKWEKGKLILRHYVALTKSRQTLMLLTTGVAGFMSSRCPWINFPSIFAVAGSLFLAISGSTVLNMWYDRDVDARMHRTCQRPLPAGLIRPEEALTLGLLLSAIGVAWAFMINSLFGSIVFLGLFIDVLIYTMWLKRRTAWSIVLGGISGGMPILAGRAYGAERIEWVGIVLALAVLFWIPTHLLTINIQYHREYELAEIPIFPSKYSAPTIRKIIAISNIAAVIAMAVACIGISISAPCLSMILTLSVGLLALSISSMIRPSISLNYGLYKYGSIYMLSAMILVAMGTM